MVLYDKTEGDDRCDMDNSSYIRGEIHLRLNHSLLFRNLGQVQNQTLKNKNQVNLNKIYFIPMESKNCLVCSNEISINFIKMTSCVHVICYPCIWSQLITKSFFHRLNKNNNTFIFNCLKCLNSSISLSYEQMDKILSITINQKTKVKTSNRNEHNCQTHKIINDHYCHTCKVTICNDCLKSIHMYHQWITIKEFKQKLRQFPSDWIHKSYKDLENSLSKNVEIITKRLQVNYDDLNAKVSALMSELNLYLTKIKHEKELKLKQIKLLSEIIKKVYKKYFSDIEEINSKDINEVKYLSKVKYEYVKMAFTPFQYINEKPTNEPHFQLPRIKSPSVNYCFIKHKKIILTFYSKTREVKECINIINTKHRVGNLLVLNENEIYFASGSISADSKEKNIQVYNVKQRRFEIIETHHANSVVCLCEVNNNRIASGSYDTTIKLWNVANYQEEGTLKGHTRCINTIRLWKEDILFSGSSDGTVKIWNLLQLKCLNSFSAHNDQVNCLYLTDDILYSGGDDNNIKLWSLSENKNKLISISEIGLLKGHLSSIFAICGNNRKIKKQIASGSKDFTIRVWKPSKLKCVGLLSGHTYDISALTFLFDNRLASASKDKTIRIWNMNSMNCDNILQAQEGPILALSVFHDGRLMSGFKDNKIRIWG